MLKQNPHLPVDLPAQRRNPFFFDDKSLTLETDTLKDQSRDLSFADKIPNPKLSSIMQ